MSSFFEDAQIVCQIENGVAATNVSGIDECVQCIVSTLPEIGEGI